jgi:hypothetical protein
MKFVLISSLLLTLITQQKDCNGKKPSSTTCFKGRLEIKAICNNYTIKVLDGNIDTSLVAARWTDENTGKQYTNVFALDSPCSFPEDIDEGEEFYFTVNPQRDKDCNVCMAYYPVPSKRLAIYVSKTPCP